MQVPGFGCLDSDAWIQVLSDGFQCGAVVECRSDGQNDRMIICRFVWSSSRLLEAAFSREQKAIGAKVKSTDVAAFELNLDLNETRQY